MQYYILNCETFQRRNQPGQIKGGCFPGQKQWKTGVPHLKLSNGTNQIKHDRYEFRSIFLLEQRRDGLSRNTRPFRSYIQTHNTPNVVPILNENVIDYRYSVGKRKQTMLPRTNNELFLVYMKVLVLLLTIVWCFAST